ncbi:MAG: peptide chain release factor-like protein [Fuerstiella sp.]
MASDSSAEIIVCDHPACIAEETLLDDCDIQRTRASGPGGQHRNKTETAIQITHRPTGLTALAYERRSQEDNRKVAVFRMRLTLAALHRTVKSRVVHPTALWESRCPKGKISCNDSHHDFPSMIAEAMNAVDAKNFDVRLAAAALGCSTSQLVRLIAKSAEAFQALNTGREQVGLRRLKP